ncbi:D-arabinono-1,4-lactone oxidase [Pseudobacteriovorax antillogorgiicola]|uniref:FAD/FMN-containing dehydrogenase n=1 Tax=Pseudobacteriovorax antillogorgiicola TaxID=1513793 RepID=A0A1Y6CQN5_9BACT|nr:D-arabinono-1,4-lactone oxidase [Pseudobacteriovorax antillogorgiicola]TCS42209.1 FAD/FMN-containing dehydrogenase [Pseudobacteriovorax antillogorgiicola]SMF82831.1 FAD/FMN-containing dehydrogenase [Pseudobacteriovorax antillogorgiicola]
MNLLSKKIVLLAGLGVSSSFAAYSIFKDDASVSNYQNTYRCANVNVVEPKNYQDIQKIVGDAVANDLKVMANASNFKSQIDAACADEGGYQVVMDGLDQLVAIDRENMLMTVQAGMRFDVFNRIAGEQGLAVNMVTELGTFSIGGMLGSGTHGSTLMKKGSMLSDYVTEMKIVSSQLDEDGMAKIITLRGEQLDAARVNLGVLGIVVEATIQMEPLFKVRGIAKAYDNDSNLEEVILDLARNSYSTNIGWFPGLGKYTVTSYEVVDDEPVPTKNDAFNAQADNSWLKEALFSGVFKLLHEVPGTWLQCTVANQRYKSRAESYWAKKGTRKRVEGAIGMSYDMQYFACKGGYADCVWDFLPIQLQETAIALDDLPDWIRDVKNLLAANPRTCFPLNGIYFRFGKASDSYLGMASGRDTAYISIEYTLRQGGVAFPLEEGIDRRSLGKKVPKNYFVNLEIEQMTLRKYDGRPHWGKNSPAIFEDVANKYPRFSEFLDAKEELDPNSVFVNPFFRRATGEQSLDELLVPGCNVTGECYCQNDSHCEKGAKCVEAAFFNSQEARLSGSRPAMVCQK